MSYDFELFTSRKHVLGLLRTNAGSNIRIDGPYRVEEEDLSDNYLPVLGKRRLLYRIHLEGELTLSDQAAVEIWLDAILAETNGVLIDLQTERFEMSNKSGQFQLEARQRNENGMMTFYFEDGEKFYQSGFEQLLQVISVLMPEAIPSRFGYYEPLQDRVNDNDLSQLISSFKHEPNIFMKSKAPFSNIYMSVPCKKWFEHHHPQHFIRRLFILGKLSFELRPKLFASPADFERLKALFEKICLLLNVVYAEIVETDSIGSWFWYGLPDKQAHTICLGAAYQSAWPSFLKTGYKLGDHHHIVTTDRFGNRPPCPPKNLIAPDQKDKNPGGKPDYAPVFPFDYEFDYNKYVW